MLYIHTIEKLSLNANQNTTDLLKTPEQDETPQKCRTDTVVLCTSSQRLSVTSIPFTSIYLQFLGGDSGTDSESKYKLQTLAGKGKEIVPRFSKAEQNQVYIFIITVMSVSGRSYSPKYSPLIENACVF